MDTDFAKEHSETIRLQILQQTATSALAQANNIHQFGIYIILLNNYL